MPAAAPQYCQGPAYCTRTHPRHHRSIPVRPLYRRSSSTRTPGSLPSPSHHVRPAHAVSHECRRACHPALCPQIRRTKRTSAPDGPRPCGWEQIRSKEANRSSSEDKNTGSPPRSSRPSQLHLPFRIEIVHRWNSDSHTIRINHVPHLRTSRISRLP